MAMAAPARIQGAAQRFVLRDVSWGDYRGFLKLLEDRPIRTTHDQGTPELMTPRSLLERCKVLFGRMIAVITEELGVRAVAVGSTAFNREDLKRGLEPDRCFYFSNDALKVPEAWRFDGDRLEVLLLQGSGAYQAVPRGGILPFPPMEKVGRFLLRYSIGDDTQWARAFRRWVRETVAPRVQDERGGE